MNRSSDPLRAWIDIDLGALVRNGERLARHAAAPLLPMVKADAYGLGVGPVVRALKSLPLQGFGVATASEGMEVRALGVTRPVLVFTPVLPLDFAALRDANLTPCLGDPAAIGAWTAAGGGAWHLAIDTGMQRAGIRWDRVADVADAVRAHPPEGAFTHFHSAESDDGSLECQEQRFREALAALPALPPQLHAENSGAIARRSPSAWSFVRPGVFLYGVGSGAGAAIHPEPVAHVRARIVDLHDVHVGESVSYGASWTAAVPSRTSRASSVMRAAHSRRKASQSGNSSSA